MTIDGANFIIPDVIKLNVNTKIFSIGRPRYGDLLIIEVANPAVNTVVVKHEGFVHATGAYNPMAGRYSNLSGTILLKDATKTYTLTQAPGGTGGEDMLISSALGIVAMRPGSDIDADGNLALSGGGKKVNDGYTYGYKSLKDIIEHHTLYGTPGNTLYIVASTQISADTKIPGDKDGAPTTIMTADRVVSGQYGTDVSIESIGNPSSPIIITIAGCPVEFSTVSTGGVI